MRKEIIKIHVASTSEKKIRALESTSGLKVEGHKIESGVNDSPVGLRETSLGANNRAEALLPLLSEGEVGCAIENGIESINLGGGKEVSIDLATICFIDKDGNKSWSVSPGVAVPQEAVNELRKVGPDKSNIGKVTVALHPNLGIDHADPHVYWTCGLTNRSELLAIGINVNMTNSEQINKGGNQEVNTLETMAQHAIEVLANTVIKGDTVVIENGKVCLNDKVTVNMAIVAYRNESGIIGWSTIPSLSNARATTQIDNNEIEKITKEEYLKVWGIRLAMANIERQQSNN